MGLYNKRIWNIGERDEAAASAISAELNTSAFFAGLLVSRGLDTVKKAKDFLRRDINGFHDPFLLKDMDRAVERIKNAVRREEKITIYGDYDVDGITSVAALYLYLKELGAKVDYYIPERLSEGYGLNRVAIATLSRCGTSLVITVDSGITAREEIEYALSAGIDTVITDHHECREQLPCAYAVINPHRKDCEYPFRDLAGVGVVFKLICALEDNNNILRICERFGDIIAIGTVADVVPLIDENRLIVSIGLQYLKNTKNRGLSALIRESFGETGGAGKKRLTACSVGFGLAPRINAAGRIGDVTRAVELFITDDHGIAQNIAKELCLQNSERQTIEKNIFEEAVSIIEETHDLDTDKVIVICSDHWHLGVIGIVSSRITDKYGLPSVLISFCEGLGKGSCRSISGFNINEALSNCKEHLVKSGGHELAAGLTIQKESLDGFRTCMREYANRVLSPDKLAIGIDVDFEITPEDITLEQIEQLSRLEPYGAGNATPLFLLRGMTIEAITPIGREKHLRLTLSKDRLRVPALYFNMTQKEFPYCVKCGIDCLVNLDINEFRGSRDVQMIVRDLRPDSEAVKERDYQDRQYRGAMLQHRCETEHIPQIGHFKSAFLFLKRRAGDSREPLRGIDVFYSAKKISESFHTRVSACMLHIMLDIFFELGLITLVRHSKHLVTVQLIHTKEKVNLNDSRLLQNIRQNSNS